MSSSNFFEDDYNVRKNETFSYKQDMQTYRIFKTFKTFGYKKDINFYEIFLQVIILTIIRVVLVMCVVIDLHLKQLNVKLYFFLENLKGIYTYIHLYRLQLEDFKEQENFVYRLIKSLKNKKTLSIG